MLRDLQSGAGVFDRRGRQVLKDAKKIIFCSADPVGCKPIEDILVSQGYTLFKSASPEETLRLVSETGPSLVVIEEDLGKSVDGLEICVRLREGAQSRGVPVMMILVNSSDLFSVQSAFDAGASDYLGKNVNPEELAARIGAMMRRSDQHEANAEREKTGVIMEMAGAAVHELSQPITALQGMIEMVFHSISKDDSLTRKIDVVRECFKKINEILDKFRKVERYETKQYMDGIKIVDLDKASQNIEFDRLTGLYTKTFLYLQLRQELNRARKSGIPICCVLVQLDDLDEICKGHLPSVRDKVIKVYSSFLQEELRKNDYLIRFGEEEFVIILHNNTVSGAKVLAERLRKKTVEIDFSSIATGLKFTSSIGISCYPVDTPEGDVDTLVQNAGIALRVAKKTGGNTIKSHLEMITL